MFAIGPFCFWYDCLWFERMWEIFRYNMCSLYENTYEFVARKWGGRLTSNNQPTDRSATVHSISISLYYSCAANILRGASYIFSCMPQCQASVKQPAMTRSPHPNAYRLLFVCVQKKGFEWNIAQLAVALCGMIGSSSVGCADVWLESRPHIYCTLWLIVYGSTKLLSPTTYTAQNFLSCTIRM